MLRKKKMENNVISIGNAGEYFVAGELERRGYTAAVPMSNTKDFDILAINRDNYNQYAIQVKTTRNKKKEWILSKKNEDIVGKNIFYIFVSLNYLENRNYHIVSSKIVAETLKNNHQLWLKTLGKNGQKHNDNNMRKFEDNEDKFLNKWDYLK